MFFCVQLRQGSYSHHRVGIGASAHHLGFFLLWSSRPGVYLPSRPLVLHQKHQRRACVRYGRFPSGPGLSVSVFDVSLSAALQWCCTLSARCISPVWWSVSCWLWRRWCACCRPWLSPACLSAIWATILRLRTTGGTLGVCMRRFTQQ